jgi:hypothetical protein
VDRNLTVADYGAAAESAFVDGLGGDGSETIRVARGGSDGRVASADATPDGKIADRIEGRASYKDHAEFRVAANLVSRLNQLGANWRSPVLLRADAREERGVDCIAHDGAGNKLLIQVTTTDQDAWGQLARDSLVVRGVTSVAVVEAIRAAIAHRLLAPLPTLCSRWMPPTAPGRPSGPWRTRFATSTAGGQRALASGKSGLSGPLSA